MKSKLVLLSLLLVALTGCSTARLANKLAEFEQLGIAEATITGKFSNTEYKTITVGDKKYVVLDHSNAWVPKVHLVREVTTQK